MEGSEDSASFLGYISGEPMYAAIVIIGLVAVLINLALFVLSVSDPEKTAWIKVRVSMYCNLVAGLAAVEVVYEDYYTRRSALMGPVTGCESHATTLLIALSIGLMLLKLVYWLSVCYYPLHTRIYQHTPLCSPCPRPYPRPSQYSALVLVTALAVLWYDVMYAPHFLAWFRCHGLWTSVSNVTALTPLVLYLIFFHVYPLHTCLKLWTSKCWAGFQGTAGNERGKKGASMAWITSLSLYALIAFSVVLVYAVFDALFSGRMEWIYIIALLFCSLEPIPYTYIVGVVQSDQDFSSD